MLRAMDPSAPSIMDRLRATLLLRCPRCCKGAVWAGPFRMNAICPVCGLVYEREPGYFVGAMYASYTLGIFLVLPIWLWMLVTGVSLAVVLLVACGLVILLMPLSFHYSRVCWMHIDCYFNPRTFEADQPAHKAGPTTA